LVSTNLKKTLFIKDIRYVVIYLDGKSATDRELNKISNIAEGGLA
jgi:hypothetical protein